MKHSNSECEVWIAVATSVIWLGLGMFVLCSCAALPPGSRATRTARITFYNPHEDKFGSRIAIGGHAKEGITMAAPAAIPFGTKVMVPVLKGVVGTGTFVIQDRGSALEKYYRRGELRLDIFVASRARMRRLQYGVPEYQEVEIK